MIFVDTSFWLALRNARDEHHAEAGRLLVEHRSEPKLSTNLVHGETWTFLRRRVGHPAAVAYLDAVEQSNLRILRVEERQEAEAWQWLRRRDERVYSFVDATSFAVMRHHRVSRALAFDAAFSAAGFAELRT